MVSVVHTFKVQLQVMPANLDSQTHIFLHIVAIFFLGNLFSVLGVSVEKKQEQNRSEIILYREKTVVRKKDKQSPAAHHHLLMQG